MNRSSGDPLDRLATFACQLALVATLCVLYALGRMLIEVFRVLYHRALKPSRTSRVLWSALAALGAVWCVSVVLTLTTRNDELSAGLAAWAFFVFVLVVEGCEWIERRHERRQVATRLDEVLAPWQPTPPAASARLLASEAAKQP